MKHASIQFMKFVTAIQLPYITAWVIALSLEEEYNNCFFSWIFPLYYSLSLSITEMELLQKSNVTDK